MIPEFFSPQRHGAQSYQSFARSGDTDRSKKLSPSGITPLSLCGKYFFFSFILFLYPHRLKDFNLLASASWLDNTLCVLCASVVIFFQHSAFQYHTVAG
jgi:hypothetical protein